MSMVIGPHEPRPSPWPEVAYFFVEHWGEHALACAIAEPLEAGEEEAFCRDVEIDGSYFFRYLLDVEMAGDLCGWLSEVVPTLWGPKQDLARMTLLLQCPCGLDIAEAGASHRRMARGFPFPMVFLLSPAEDWRGWLSRHRFMFGRQIPCLGGDPDCMSGGVSLL